MVTKTKAGQKKGKVKVGKLKLNKETVKDLSAGEQEKVKGGRLPTTTLTNTCYTEAANCTASQYICGRSGV